MEGHATKRHAPPYNLPYHDFIFNHLLVPKSTSPFAQHVRVMRKESEIGRFPNRASSIRSRIAPARSYRSKVRPLNDR
jgi:hypothetical protein